MFRIRTKLTHGIQHEHAMNHLNMHAHTDHECEYCLVYSFALPLFETKLRLRVNPNTNSGFVF